MKLDEYLSERGIKPANFASQIGVERSTVKRWIDGDRFPERAALELIYKATEGQVTANDFFENQSAPEPPEAM